MLTHDQVKEIQVSQYFLLQVYHFDSEQEKQRSGQKCCGSRLTDEDKLCCNGHGYEQYTQVCADVSHDLPGRFYG